MSLFDTGLLAERVTHMDSSGVRKVFDLARHIEDPINLSIGQPDFDVPDPLKETAAQAVLQGKNAYTQTQGAPEFREALSRVLPQGRYSEKQVLVTSGVSGALTLAFLALLNPGDEILTADPYFVAYKQLARLCGATPVFFDSYPDFELRPERIEPLITSRTKAIVFSSPGNPTGRVATPEELKALADLAQRHNLLLIADELYHDYVYDGERASVGDYTDNALILDGLSKSHAMTGWRLGWATGPETLIQAMTKLQQFTYVCAPSFAQVAAAEAVGHPLTEKISAYRSKRDRVYEALQSIGYEVERPGGAFYIFPKAPWGTDTEFVEEAIRQKLLIIPGGVFSEKNTHFRISYAASDETLDRGLEVLEKIYRR